MARRSFKKRSIRWQRRRKRGVRTVLFIISISILIIAAQLIVTAMVGGGPPAEESPAPAVTQQPEPSSLSTASPPSETQAPSATPEAVPTPAPTRVAEEPQSQKNDFSDSVFIGDSMAEGFQLFSGIQGATFYFERGLRLEDVATDLVANTPNGKTTILDALRQRQYGRVILILGLNELGWDNSEVFRQRYCNLVDSIQEIQPGAEIYLQAILPVTQERSSSDRIFKNEDIAQYNEKIAQVAAEKGVHYLDVSSVMTDSTGALLPDATGDGIHLNKKYCEKWLAYITANI